MPLAARKLDDQPRTAALKLLLPTPEEAARAAADGASPQALWTIWAAGLPLPSDESLGKLEHAARTQGQAHRVIESALLRTLAAEARGEAPAMLALARRVSRMARTESLPLLECAAHIALARARRLHHQPHLAIRILTAVQRVAPPELDAWIAWERVLAGDVPAPLASSPAPAHPAAQLHEALTAAQEGDRAAFERSASALMHTPPWVRCDALEVLAALDLERAPPPSIEGWCAGRNATAPASVHGLCQQTEGEGDHGQALMLAAPGAAGRRILAHGVGLATRPPTVVLRKTRRRQGRVETLVAVLASAGPGGLEDKDCFAQTYEFPYQAEVHRGVFDVLLTRARAYLGEAGRVVRADGRIAILPSIPLLVPDPRCVTQVHDRLLRVLARDGTTNASDAAKHVGLSLRAVQDALRTLTDEGLCSAEKQGRQVIYTVEDTTFSEATELGARRSGPL